MPTKWAKFTYVEKQTRLITKLFKNSNPWISFMTENTTEKLLNVNKNINMNKFKKCGIYQLICPDWDMKYIGQTGNPSV